MIARFWPHGLILLVYAEIAFALLRRELQRGLIGDHTHFVAYLLSNRLFFEKNGFFALPYYSPAFGGGMPRFADPEDMALSMLQWFCNLAPDVYTGVKLAYLASLVLAYAGLYRLLRHIDVRPPVAAVGAFLWSISGFFTMQWMVGHLTYHMYWILPWMLYLCDRLRDERLTVRRLSVLGMAMLTALTVFGAGVTPLLHAGLLCGCWVLARCFIAAPDRRLQEAQRLLIGGTAAAAWAMVLAAVKLLPTFEYMRQWPREYPNEYLGLSRALFLLPRAFFDPQPTIGTQYPLQIYGWFENGAYVGLSLGLFLVAALVIWLVRTRQGEESLFAPKRRSVLLWIGLSLVASMYLYIGWNWGWWVLKHVPVLQSVHVPSRIVGAMSLVLVVGACVLLDYARRRGGRGARGAALILVLWPLDVLAYHAYHNHMTWPFRESPQPTLAMPLAEFRIARWARGDSSPEALSSGAGDVYPFNALFGYGTDFIQSKQPVNPDLPPMTRLPDGRWNVHDPAAMLYGSDLGRRPWSLLPADTPEEQVRRFLAFERPGFYVPVRQKVVNAVSLLAWLASLSAWLWLLLAARKGRSDGR